jgi:hypothetical protein
MAEAISLSVSFVDVTASCIDLLPTEIVRLPVPSELDCAVVKAPEERLCACAICVTSTEYEPATAPVAALAVSPLPLAVAVKVDCSVPLKSGASPTCSDDSEAESVPIAEIWVLSLAASVVSAAV